MCRSPSHTVRTSIHNFVISVIIKYHNFWAKLRYINIFRKNYLKHVVKNNYIIKPFFSVLITISLIFQTLNRVGWVSVVKINHMTKLCHFVSLIVLTEFWCLLGDLTQNGHRMTLSRQVKAKDSEGCCFALDETSDVTQNRTKLTAMKRLQDTCCIYTKTEKKSLHFFFFLWLILSCQYNFWSVTMQVKNLSYDLSFYIWVDITWFPWSYVIFQIYLTQLTYHFQHSPTKLANLTFHVHLVLMCMSSGVKC